MDGALETQGGKDHARRDGKSSRGDVWLRDRKRNRIPAHQVTQERADAAWERIHTITRWNYAALSAAALLTGVDYERFGPSKFRIGILCGFVIVTALTAAVLAWLQANYALWLYRYAYMLERAWLRNRNSLRIVQKIEYLRDVASVEQSDTVSLHPRALAEMFASIHVLVNMVPAVAAALALIILSHSEVGPAPPV